MGKQARLKEKHRREEQLRAKGRKRAVAHADAAARRVVNQLVETFETAPLADRKAIEASLAEVAAQIEADPAQAALALVNYRRIITATPPGGRHGKPVTPGELPHLAAKLAAAQNTLYGSVPTACQHLKPSDPAAYLCIDEPDRILCAECSSQHGASHPPEWDFQCLECGGVDLRGISVCTVPPLVGLPVRFGTEDRSFISPVIVTGIGVCNSCRLGVGKKRDRAA